MADSTRPYDSYKRSGDEFDFPVLEAVWIQQGVLVALTAAGLLQPARDAADLSVVGRAEREADNRLGASSALTCRIERGIFSFVNSSVNALTAADVGKMVYIEDDKTVGSTGTHKCKAGRLVAMGDTGSNTVWVDTREALGATVIATDATTNGAFTTHAASATAAADNAALKVVVNAMAVELEKAADLLRSHQTALQAAGIVK